MNFGICTVNIVPIRKEPMHTCEMTSQLLFGELFKIIEVNKKWLYIKCTFDGYQGWIDSRQIQLIEETIFNKLKKEDAFYNNELINFCTSEKEELIPLTLGAKLPSYKNKTFKIKDTLYQFDGAVCTGLGIKENIVKTAFLYLNAPFLWGGKTPFGIDCSGFAQMVYRLNGYKLFRNASQQAKQGELLSFIEESTPGDLAFFDDENGQIDHVGIVLSNNFIIHSSGKVRLDRLDQSGIFNESLNKHTHKLRLIKKIF